jgi:DNA mismatch endonuclease, patch repair protein
MTDVFTKAKRSAVMARIRSRGNRDTELALVRLLRAHKISGWRRQILLRVPSDKWRVTGKARGSIASRVTRHPSRAALPGSRLTVRPDFVFRTARTAIFVDGCFWHGCPRHATQPKNNREFWRAKLAANRRRDALVTRTLRRAGWRVVRIWECDLAKARRKKISTRHPKPSPPAPLPSDGRGWRRAHPGRGGAGAEARIVRRIQQALG